MVVVAASFSGLTVAAEHSRLAQVMGDAVHDGILTRSPCSRRTSPSAGPQRPYVATTEQIWALHDAFPPHLRVAVLLGAFAGLRTAEVCGLRVSDVDFMRAVITPARQYPDEPLKSDAARTSLPVPQELALQLAASVAEWGSEFVVTDGRGSGSSPWAIDRAVRAARGPAQLQAGVRFHDLRHYLASLLITSIGSGLDVKVVQHRLRHASASTTLTPTRTCGRTRMSPHGPLWVRFWRLVRTQGGLQRCSEDITAGQGPDGA